jgi:hypothetical protein
MNRAEGAFFKECSLKDDGEFSLRDSSSFSHASESEDSGLLFHIIDSKSEIWSFARRSRNHPHLQMGFLFKQKNQLTYKYR